MKSFSRPWNESTDATSIPSYSDCSCNDAAYLSGAGLVCEQRHPGERQSCLTK